MHAPRSILITGASSGIGEALARLYAAPGVALALSGRDSARLGDVAEACRSAGATVRADIVDVADASRMQEWIAGIEAWTPLELVIANAGIGGGGGDSGEPEDQARRILKVNVDGVLNTISPALPYLLPRRRGQVAIMSSLASFRGFPGAPAYCASKAAVRVWGESLRGELHGRGIEVSVICPGFVVSRMTAGNRFRMPMLMAVDKAARIIRRGLENGHSRIAFPLPMYAAAWLAGALPPRLTDPLFRGLPKKAPVD